MTTASTPRLSWLDRLMGSTKPHIRYLDGIRAVAVLSVLLRHVWGLSGSPRLPVFGVDLSPIMVMLSSGVDLFFVLSGFLLAQSFIRADFEGRPRPSVRRYFKARILRIGPPYWLALVLVVLLFTPTFIDPARVFSLTGLVIFSAHALFLQAAYFPSFGGYQVAMPFWTLTVEMFFYLTLPVLVVAFLRNRWRWGIPLLASISLVWLWAARYRDGKLVNLINGPLNVFPEFPESVVRFFLSHQFPAFLLDFAIGMTVANLVVRKRTTSGGSARFARWTSETAGKTYFALGAVLTVAALWTLGRLSLAGEYAYPPNYMESDGWRDRVYYYFETIPFGIGYGLVLLGVCLGGRWLQTGFSWRPLAFVGVIGYSVYLLHMPLLYLCNGYPWIGEDTDAGTHFLKLLLFGTPLILLLSTGFFIAVERPAMRWSRAVSAAAPAAAAAAPPPPPAAPVGRTEEQAAELAPSPVLADKAAP